MNEATKYAPARLPPVSTTRRGQSLVWRQTRRARHLRGTAWPVAQLDDGAAVLEALYLPGACAADGEHRELAGVPEQVMFATKPELADALLERAHSAGIRAAF